MRNPGADWSSARLETPRLLLRPLRAGDAGALRRARDDAEIRRWAPSLGDEPARSRSGLLCVVTEQDTGDLVGAAELDPDGSRSVTTARLELWIARWARRRGLGTEVAGGLCSWAFRQGNGRVELLVGTTNEPGQRLALAAGFRREGQLRSALAEGRVRADAVVFSRLPTDPAAAAPRALPDAGELSDGVVTVRRLRAGDEDALLDERADGETRRWATSSRLWTAPDVRTFVAGTPAFWLAGVEARFAILDTASGACAGTIGLRISVPAFGIAELGYGLRPAWRGRGLTTRAVRLVADWAFTQAGVARLEIGAAVGNVASQRVAERAGFVREGIARQRLPTAAGGRVDEVRFGLTPGS